MSFLSLSISFSPRPSPSFPLLLQFPLPLPHFPLYTPLSLIQFYPVYLIPLTSFYITRTQNLGFRFDYISTPHCVLCVCSIQIICVCVYFCIWKILCTVPVLQIQCAQPNDTHTIVLLPRRVFSYNTIIMESA